MANKAADVVDLNARRNAKESDKVKTNKHATLVWYAGPFLLRQVLADIGLDATYQHDDSSIMVDVMAKHIKALIRHPVVEADHYAIRLPENPSALLQEATEGMAYDELMDYHQFEAPSFHALGIAKDGTETVATWSCALACEVDVERLRQKVAAFKSVFIFADEAGKAVAEVLGMSTKVKVVHGFDAYGTLHARVPREPEAEAQAEPTRRRRQA